MTVTTAQHEYNLVFQGHTTGPATVVSCQVPSAKGDRINIRVLGPDGSPSSMESVMLKFKVKRGPASPLGDGTKANYLWQAGDQDTYTVNADGDWEFGAVLTAKNGTQYTLPDPEFQVGDGGDGRPALVHSA
jgi:hypothetical protein